MKTRNDLLNAYHRETGISTDTVKAAWPSTLGHLSFLTYVKWMEELIFKLSEKEVESSQSKTTTEQIKFIINVSHKMTTDELLQLKNYKSFLKSIPSSQYTKFLYEFENHTMEEMMIEFYNTSIS